MYTRGNGLDQIQIQLDFETWILIDLDLIGYGYPFNLDLIELDLLVRKLEDNPNPIGLVEGNGRTIAAAMAGRQRSVAGRRPSGHRPLFFLTCMVSFLHSAREALMSAHRGRWRLAARVIVEQ